MAVTIIFVVVQLSLMIFNRPLFCKIAMFGGIGQVPAMCLANAIKDIK